MKADLDPRAIYAKRRAQTRFGRRDAETPAPGISTSKSPGGKATIDAEAIDARRAAIARHRAGDDE